MPDLTSYPRPNLAVDLVILAVDTRPEERPSLGVVVQRPTALSPGPAPVLPGRFVREQQTVLETVQALLTEKLAFTPERKMVLEMLGIYDAPGRDDRGWVVSVSHLTTISSDDAARLSRDVVDLLPVRGPADRGRKVTAERLGFGHDDMVTTAVRRARRRYERSPDPLRLTSAPYTLSELRHVHEAVLGEPLKRDTFNRRMSPFLVPVTDRRGRVQLSDTGGRPAQLFRPATRHDRDPEAGPFPLPRST